MTTLRGPMARSVISSTLASSLRYLATARTRRPACVPVRMAGAPPCGTGRANASRPTSAAAPPPAAAAARFSMFRRDTVREDLDAIPISYSGSHGPAKAGRYVRRANRESAANLEREHERLNTDREAGTEKCERRLCV